MAFITIDKDKIIDIIEKRDVYIVYVEGRKKAWVCDKSYKPTTENNLVKYKLAEK